MEKFPNKHPLQIKTPELQKSDDVQKSVEKKERLSKAYNDKIPESDEETERLREKIPNEPSDRIEAHMARLEKIFLNSDENTRKRNLEMLKPAIYDAYIIKPDEVPESYFELQQRIARERGIDAETITPEIQKQMIETVIEDQRHSLDQWIDYLTSDDAMYPTWFKFFAFQNITKLSQFDKSLGKFKKRTNDTVAPYPDVHREPLAQICDIYEQVAEDNNLLKTDPEIQRQFSTSFPKLYAEKITESLAARMESNEEIRGEWIKYDQNDQTAPKKLYDSLQGKGTGWCTAGQSTAETQIQSGDFYVYYTYDNNNQPTQPRLAIRMQGKDKIGEVRGINEHQNVEPILSGVLDGKLSEFGEEAEAYKQKVADMEQLTAIDNKLKENPNTTLSPDELRFLYEIDHSIEGFGYQRDPRIAEIISTRNPTEDLPILFDCTPAEIATNQQEISENTKVYNGPLYKNIFNELPKTIEKIYTNFPEKISEVYIKEIEIPTEEKTAEQLIQERERVGDKVSEWAKDILPKANLKEGLGQTYKLIIPSVSSLGFPNGATRAEIQARAKELGFGKNLLPAIAGPELRKQYREQPDGEYILVDMEAILDRDGSPGVLRVNRDSDGLWLFASYGRPDRRWYGGHRWGFSQVQN